MFHPENSAIIKGQALKHLQRNIQSPDAALAIGAAEVLEPQVLAFILNGNMVQEVKAEPLADLPVEKGVVNDFSGAVISPEPYANTTTDAPMWLGDVVVEV